MELIQEELAKTKKYTCFQSRYDTLYRLEETIHEYENKLQEMNTLIENAQKEVEVQESLNKELQQQLSILRYEYIKYY